jgi:triphosphoribosyl-dephospho-CoA synthase
VERKNNIQQYAQRIMQCAQLAAALEVSAWPKPGNVHRTADFSETKFEHFIAGSIALGPTAYKAATRGVLAGLQSLDLESVGIGSLIKETIENVKSWHSGGNTHLGISLLFIPLSAAAGFSLSTLGKLQAKSLRQNIKQIVEATSIKDAGYVYEAITLAGSAAIGKLKQSNLPDLSDQKAQQLIQQKQLTLYDLMKASSKWDNIAGEWSSGFEICFSLGYPTLIKLFNESNNLNLAIVHTFLTILSEFPDTFIARKIGVKHTPFIEEAVRIGFEATYWVSETAKSILTMGGLRSTEGTQALWDFDNELRKTEGELNPGTTADITAGSLMIALLCGLRY